MARLATASQVDELRNEFQDLLAGVPGDFVDGVEMEEKGFFAEKDTQVFARVRPVLEDEARAGHFRTVYAAAANKMSVQMLSTTFKGLPKLNQSDFKVWVDFLWLLLVGFMGWRSGYPKDGVKQSYGKQVSLH